MSYFISILSDIVAMTNFLNFFPIFKSAIISNGIPKKRDPKPGTLGGTRDSRPGTHFVGVTRYPRPETLKVRNEARDPGHLLYMGPKTCDPGH